MIEESRMGADQREAMKRQAALSRAVDNWLLLGDNESPVARRLVEELQESRLAALAAQQAAEQRAEKAEERLHHLQEAIRQVAEEMQTPGRMRATVGPSPRTAS